MIKTKLIQSISNTIRGLSVDAINKANSGHPGLPLGCADIISVLYANHLNHNPKNPSWINRDRFILSAGHGSMLLYSILHLSNYALSLEDIKNFRVTHSITAGHPEYDVNYGIETTTGPLGQGIGHAVGMALSEKMAGERLNTETHKIIDHTIYCLAGDGCLMEGISSEVSSLAGHLNLDNLIVIYDSNDICLDGPTNECFTEDVKKRYESYGWHTITIDGHNNDDIDNAFTDAKKATKPVLIIAKTKIGFGSPNRENSSEAHGKPLGSDESLLTKQKLGIPTEPEFYVPDDVKTFFKNQQSTLEENENQWQSTFKQWQTNYPEKNELLNQLQTKNISTKVETNIINSEIKENSASRSSSQSIIQTIASDLGYLIGGSADLSCSDSTYIKSSDMISKNNFNEQNIKYGVREFGMSTIAAGLYLGGFFQPFIGTFLTFSDYMKNGIRLAALMKLPIIYQFTHDSIFLGEDGPTHQPIEHLASLRSIPGLTVIRPADTKEVKGAWLTALNNKQPTALILSRQGLKDLPNSNIQSMQKGAYLIKNNDNKEAHVTILATGSEVSLAINVANELDKQNIPCNVISFPSWELFDKQDNKYQDNILPRKSNTHYVVIEAQSSFGWQKYVGRHATFITVETFGLSGPGNTVAKEFGFTVDAICTKIKQNAPLLTS
ncbi:MAG: transketolase [Actinobacteria bacterium]|nr:transketolase [Actinomycetota bacterium]|tara:strand:- start:2036 stop:4036 length:2001 start_codon:yes stop_codon:yes gene_type:complete